METDVIYARVQPSLKEAVEAYAGEAGMTLTAAVSDLLARGIEATTKERSVTDLSEALAKARLDLAHGRSRIATLEERERNLHAVLAQLDSGTLGHCPTPGCNAPLSASDLVVRRMCPRGHTLGMVLEQVAKAPGLNPTEVLAAVAAIGLLLAIVALAKK